MPARVAAWELDLAHVLDEHLAAILPESGAPTFTCEVLRLVVKEEDLVDTETGRTPEEVAVMMALLAYAYAEGTLSSRQIARACQRRVDYIALTAARPPDFRAVATFRDVFAPTLGRVLARWIAVADKAGFMVAEDTPAHVAVRWLETSHAVDAEEDARFGQEHFGVGEPPWLGDARARERRLRVAVEALSAPGTPPADDPARKPMIRAHSRSTTTIIQAFPDDPQAQEQWRADGGALHADPHAAAPADDGWRDDAVAAHGDAEWHEAGHEDGGWAEEPHDEDLEWRDPGDAHADWDEEDHEQTVARAAMPDEPEPPPPPQATRSRGREGRAREASAPAPAPRAPARPRSSPAPAAPPAAEQPAPSTGAAAAVEIIRHVKDAEDRLILVEVVLGAAVSDGAVTSLEQRRIQSLVRFLRFDDAAKSRIIKLMRSGQQPPIPTAAEVPDYDVRLFIFEQAAEMVLVDGRPDEHEREYLREVALAFELMQEDVKAALTRVQQTLAG